MHVDDTYLRFYLADADDKDKYNCPECGRGVHDSAPLVVHTYMNGADRKYKVNCTCGHGGDSECSVGEAINSWLDVKHAMEFGRLSQQGKDNLAKIRFVDSLRDMPCSKCVIAKHVGCDSKTTRATDGECPATFYTRVFDKEKQEAP